MMMDIAALSMDMKATQLNMNVGIAVAKKAMDSQEVEAQGLFEMIDSSIPVESHIIDTRA